MLEPLPRSHQETLAQDRSRLYAILAELPAVVGVLEGPDHEIAFANPRFTALAGDAEVQGRPVAQLFDDPGPELGVLLDNVRRARIGATGIAWRGDLGGREVFLDYAFVPLQGSDSILVHAVDVTERHAAEREREVLLAREREARREAELAAGRIARLQRMTAALSAAISAEEVAEIVTDHAIEALGAQAALITRCDGDELVIHAHRGYPAETIVKWQRTGVDQPLPLTEAVTKRAVILIEDADEAGRRYPALARGDRFHEALAALPLVFHGAPLGSLGLSFAEPRQFSAGDRGFLLALGRQCAQALERARLYEERAYVARTLQDGLLPARLADVPGLEVAVRYRSISDGGAVGGDFYDLFATRSDDGTASRWLLAIGDVCGKGTAAAVLTGVARNTIRAIAMREPEPEHVLAFLNETMLRQDDPTAYCTVGCAAMEAAPGGDGLALALASGGHECPLLIRPGEPVAQVEVSGTLLGAVPDIRLDRRELVLRPGDALVYITDGVIDARHDGDRFGQERLRTALESAREGSAEEIASTVEAAVDAHDPGRPTDDRAVLVLRAR